MTTRWTSASSVRCTLGAAGGAEGAATSTRVAVDILFSTRVQPFFYGPPRDGTNMPTNFPMMMRITGSSYASTDNSPQVRVGSGGLAGGGGGGGGTSSEATVWVSDSTVVSKTAQKIGATHLLMLTVGERAGSASESVSYDRGMPSHVLTFEEAATGARSATVMGIGFGSVNCSSYTLGVRLGDSACEATDWVSSTAVRCASAGGVFATRRVLLTSGQEPSTITETYSYERPMLSEVLPANAAATGRMTITCFGSNFGLVDYTVAFRVGGTSCEASRWVADSAVKCKLAAGVSSNRWVEVSAGVRKSAALFSLFTYSDSIGSFQIWTNGAFMRKCDKYNGACGWTGAVHGLVINEPGTAQAAACAGTDGLWPQGADKFRVCSKADCALGSCTSNSVMRSDYPTTRTFSYDSPTIFHHSAVPPSGNSAFGSTAGGWLLTIVGRNFGFYADVVNVSVASSLFDNALKSQATGRYWHGKAACRIPCTPGAEADAVGQLHGDEYQCDEEFAQGAGNRWMSDSHIMCIMPAGVGVGKGLTLAVGSAQVDGPSPVPALAADTQYGQAHGFGRTISDEAYVSEPDLIYVESSRDLLGWGYCRRELTAQGATAKILAGVDVQLVTSLGKVCREDEDCYPPPPPIEYDELGNALPQPPRLPDLDDDGNELPPWRCMAYGTLVRSEPAPAVSQGLEVAIAAANLGAPRDEVPGGGGLLYGDKVRR